ncbi:MAG: PIG-L family deacetylase [Candidatus Pacebacteria bacterium]|nr:PIG-L family deacetylase [Candidatus Paceibacterota bacterium]
MNTPRLVSYSSKDIPLPIKVVCFFAHPDDETFGPGASLALWAQRGVEIHVVCATKGEGGGDGRVRTKELRIAAKLLGVTSVEFLRYNDGKISNDQLQKLEKDFLRFIKKYKPDAVLTYDLNGISGHMDHIAIASSTTQAFRKNTIPQALYYFVSKKYFTDQITEYFIYFPDGKERHEVNLIIDTSSVWELRVKAMYCHKTQMKDVENILGRSKNVPKEDWFVVKRRG